MKEIRQGDVYWLDFGPSSGSGPAERHPCVVVQSDVFNRSRIATTVVCLITSNCSASTIFTGQRQLFLPIGDNYGLCVAVLLPYTGAGRSRG